MILVPLGCSHRKTCGTRCEIHPFEELKTGRVQLSLNEHLSVFVVTAWAATCAGAAAASSRLP